MIEWLRLESRRHNKCCHPGNRREQRQREVGRRRFQRMVWTPRTRRNSTVTPRTRRRMPAGLRRASATAPTTVLQAARQAVSPYEPPDNLNRCPFVLNVVRRKQTQGAGTNRIRIVLLSAKVQFQDDKLYVHTQRRGRTDATMFTRDSPGCMMSIEQGCFEVCVLHSRPTAAAC